MFLGLALSLHLLSQMDSDDSLICYCRSGHCRPGLAVWIVPVLGCRQFDAQESSETCHAAAFVTSAGIGWKSPVC